MFDGESLWWLRHPWCPRKLKDSSFTRTSMPTTVTATRPADDEGDSPMDLEDQPEQRWQDVLPQIQHTFEDAKPWWCAGNLECRE